MRELIKAVRQSAAVRLVDDWYAEFAGMKDVDNQYNSERDWKFVSAVRILKEDGIVGRKEESPELNAMAQIIKEEPDSDILKPERRQDHEGK